jgi:hypothetical protein
MDRIEKLNTASEFANEGEVNEADGAALLSPTGREDHLGLTESGRIAASEIKKPVGARPRSEVTGRHDAGSGANETADGLTSLEEALRQAAEDIPVGSSERADDDEPVFDRANLLPKI